MTPKLCVRNGSAFLAALFHDESVPCQARHWLTFARVHPAASHTNYFAFGFSCISPTTLSTLSSAIVDVDHVKIVAKRYPCTAILLGSNGGGHTHLGLPFRGMNGCFSLQLNVCLGNMSHSGWLMSLFGVRHDAGAPCRRQMSCFPLCATGESIPCVPIAGHSQRQVTPATSSPPQLWLPHPSNYIPRGAFHFPYS